MQTLKLMKYAPRGGAVRRGVLGMDEILGRVTRRARGSKFERATIIDPPRTFSGYLQVAERFGE